MASDELQLAPNMVQHLLAAAKSHTCAAKLLGAAIEKSELPMGSTLHTVALLAIQLHDFDHGGASLPRKDNIFWVTARMLSKEVRGLVALTMPCELRDRYSRLLGVQLTEPVPCHDEVIDFLLQTFDSGRDLIPVRGAILATSGVLN